MVVKLKSYQQNSILTKLNKMIDSFVFESFSNDVYRYTFWELFLTAPTKHKINIA